MKQPIFLALFFAPGIAFCQNQKWRVAAQLGPQLTIYRTGYPDVNSHNKSSFNYGGNISLQRDFNNRFFAGLGIGYISRTFHTNAILNQAALPDSKRSFSAELVTTEKVTYHIVSVPVVAGINLIRTSKITGFATAGVAMNCVASARYQSNFSKYDGTYTKNELQGFSVSAGAGLDYRLSDKLALTTTLCYAFLNPQTEDAYLMGRTAPQALSFTAIDLGMGFRMQL